MRIIGGTHAGLRLHPPSTLPVRPTTDRTKEALFNVLQNRVDFDNLQIMDLFSGTGNIAFEAASRGAMRVLAVDIHFKCVQYINQTAKDLGMDTLRAVKADALKYLTASKDTFDLVFADPPYDLPQLPQIPDIVFSRGLLNTGGILILEHSSVRKIGTHANFQETRKYGYSSFSFYQAS